jgi:hypothetical protein
MVTVIGYTSTRFGTTFAFFTTAKIAAFAASNSWPPPSQFLLYVTVNFISPSSEAAEAVVLFKVHVRVVVGCCCCLDRCKNKNLPRAVVSVLLASVKLRMCLFSLSLSLALKRRGVQHTRRESAFEYIKYEE